MATFAILRNNIVENIIIADDVETAKALTGLDAVEYTEENPARIGDSFDAINNIFVFSESIIDVEEVTPTPALEG